MAVTDKERARLKQLVHPGRAALLTMELQEAIVGTVAMLPALPLEVARSGLLETTAGLCTAARSAGVRVVHCTLESRPDGAGASQNCKLWTLREKQRLAGHAPDVAGSPGAGLALPLRAEPEDIVVPRLHGMTPFTSTSLDQILRNLGVGTVIVTGVSVNLGIMGLCLTALDLGYQIVLVRDAVAGIPADYARAVIENSLSLIASVVTAKDVIAAWG